MAAEALIIETVGLGSGSLCRSRPKILRLGPLVIAFEDAHWSGAF